MRNILFTLLLTCLLFGANKAYAQDPTNALEFYVWEAQRNSGLTVGDNWEGIFGLGSNGKMTIAGSGGTSGTQNVSTALASGYRLRQVTLICTVEISVTLSATDVNADTNADSVTLVLPAGSHNFKMTNLTSLVVTNGNASSTDVYGYVFGIKVKSASVID